MAGGEPDIELQAAARGRDLRIGAPPRVTLRADEVSAAREGLPRPVRPRVTYRRFSASTRLVSRLRLTWADRARTFSRHH